MGEGDRRMDKKQDWNPVEISKKEIENHLTLFENNTFWEEKQPILIENLFSNYLLKNIYGCFHDVWGSIVFVNDNFLTLFGYSKEEINQLFDGQFFPMIYEEDQNRIEKEARNQQEEPAMEFCYRVRHKNGTLLWILDKGWSLKKQDGSKYCCHLLLDVTKIKGEEIEKHLSREWYRIVLDQCLDTIFEWNIESDTFFCSSNWFQIFGFHPVSDHISEKILFSENIYPEDKEQLKLLMKRIRKGEPYVEIEFRIKGKGETFFWYKIRAATHYDKNGAATKATGLLVNIDKDKKLSQSLLEKAAKDALTGLYNHTAARKQIEFLLETSDKEAKHAFLIIDLDNFKQINDTKGHLYGDAILTEFSKCLQSLFHSTDILGRVGGDEFVVFLKNIGDYSLVSKKAEEIKNIFKKEPFTETQNGSVSGSIGIALYPLNGIHYLQLYEKADKALYGAKRNGKNCFVFYNDEIYYENIKNPKNEEIEEKINLTNPQQMLYQSQEIVEHIFNLLYDTRDIDISIKMILEITGRYFDVSRVYIVENSKDNLYCSNTYEWCNEGIPAMKEKLQNLSYKNNFQEYLELFSEKGILYCKTVDILPDEIRTVFQEQNTVSFLQCAIQDNGMIRGFVGVDECRFSRLWTKEQIDILVMISNILSTFLMKRKLEGQLELNSNMIQSIMNATEDWNYIIERPTCEILFYNHKIKECYPKVQSGSLCHEVFFQRKEPCKECPLKMESKPEQNGQTHMFIPALGEPVFVKVSPIPWAEDKEIAMVNLTSVKKKARQEEGLEKQYDKALESCYMEIYECDLEKKKLTLLLHNTEISYAFCYTGEMERDIENLSYIVHPEDKNLFCQFYNIYNIRNRLSSGEKEIIEEYRKVDSEGQYRWVCSAIIPLDVEKYGFDKALILIKDITDKKNLDIIKTQMEDRYNLVFKHYCDIATEVNLKTGQFTQKEFSDKSVLELKCGENYQNYLNTFVYPFVCDADKKGLAEVFDFDKLKEAYQNQKEERTYQFQMMQKNMEAVWQENRVFFVEENKEAFAFITTKDISKKKQEEYERNVAEQYDSALRKIYDELYEWNVTKNTYQIVYHAENKYITLPEKGILSDEIQYIADNIIHPEDRERFLYFANITQIRETFTNGAESALIEARILWTNGEYHWTSLTVFPVKVEKNGDEIFLCFVMDISEKKRKESIEEQNRILKKQLDEERYRIIVEQTGAIVSEWEAGTKCQKHNPKLAENFVGNYDERELFQIWKEDGVICPLDKEQFEIFQEEISKNKPYAELLARFNHKKRGFIWCKVVSTCIFDEEGKPKRYIETLSDVDEATKSVETLKYRVEFDTLTGIHNMETFYTLAEKKIQEHVNKKFAVVRMDINRFKFINDIYGMEEGDHLLQFIASVIGNHMKESDTYGRIGGDVFGMCIEYEEKGELIRLMEEISHALNEYQLGYKVVPAFGLCLVDDRTVPASILCDWAGLAIKTVKGNMIRTWAFYDDKLRAKQLEERKVEDQMEGALKNKEFCVYFQPKYQIENASIIGAEALVRWIHPKKGMRSPDSFIPLFERNGFIMKLDEYIWEETFAYMKKWKQEGKAEIPISINVSRHHIYNTNFCEKILSLANKYQIPHRLIELELTESLFVDNPEELYKTMGDLQKRGFRFSMDDFGAGYSSLNMLKNTPVNTIKLDRGFLNETVSTDKGKLVVECAIEMAKKLELDVIAEGVETKEQADFLLKSGCQKAQGFYYSKPIAAEEFEQLLKKEKK